MKTIYPFLFLVLICCISSNAEKNAPKLIKKPQAPPQGDAIVGDWKLTLEKYDGNHNKI